MAQGSDQPIGGQPISGQPMPQLPVRPPETPFQELAWSEDDYVADPIPVEKPVDPGLEDAVPVILPPKPMPLSITVPPATPMLVCQREPYRRTVMVLAIGDAVLARFHYRHDVQVLEQMIVLNGNLPVPIPVHENMELWVEHDTDVYQDMSFNIEPRWAGR